MCSEVADGLMLRHLLDVVPFIVTVWLRVDSSAAKATSKKLQIDLRRPRSDSVKTRRRRDQSVQIDKNPRFSTTPES